MWIVDAIKFLGKGLKWALENPWYILGGLALLFSPILRNMYKSIKTTILSMFTYEGIISFVVSIILLLILFKAIGLI